MKLIDDEEEYKIKEILNKQNYIKTSDIRLSERIDLRNMINEY